MKKIFLHLLAICSLLAFSCDKNNENLEKTEKENNYFFVGKTYSYKYNKLITDERDPNYMHDCQITYSLNFISVEQIIKSIKYEYPSKIEKMCDTIIKTEEISDNYQEVVEKKQASIKFDPKSLYFNILYWNGNFNAKFEDEHTLSVSDSKFGNFSSPFGNFITLTDTILQ